MNTKHQTAEDAYAAHHAAILALLNDLTEAVENLPAPSDAIHWGQVGDVGRIEELLRQAWEVAE